MSIPSPFSVIQARLRKMTANTILGRATTAGPVQELTAAQVRALIDLSAQIQAASLGGVLSGTVAAATFASDMATQAELDSEASTRSTADGLRVLKAGDTMSGDLAMGTHRVTGLADPSLAQDADTKAARDAAIVTHAAASDPYARSP